MIVRFALLMLILGTLLTVPAQLPAAAPETSAASIRGLDEFIRERMAAFGVPGASVAIVQRGRTIFLRGYGVRRVGERAPVDENTVFQIGSDTTFTAAALAALVGDGRCLRWNL
jgi:CubicO group peptidase (beta-lactamase class C family)